ncbi:MAG: peptidase [Labilithrix sp.]|nr:peptidase [Labilithrix sp.]
MKTRMLKLAGLGALAVLAGCSQAGDTDSGGGDGKPGNAIELRPISLSGNDAVELDQIGTAAVRFATLRRVDLGLSIRDELRVNNVRRGAGSATHVRMGQYLDGVRVFGGDVVAHASSDAITGLSGRLATHLDDFDVKPALSADAAATAAKADFAGNETFTFERESTELVVLPAEEGAGATLAYRVEFYTELQNGRAPALMNTFVDAKTGAIVKKFNAIHTLSQASGPGGNAKVPRTWSNALDVEASGSTYVENTTRLKTVTLAGKTSGTGTVISGSLSNIGDAAENDAHGFAEVTLNMLSEWMGYNSIDEAGYKINSRVHYSKNYENAYWDGTQMTYGDGAATFYPLSGAVDVVAHEIDHGFTSYHSNLSYTGQSGGMNEAFSDIAGTIAEFYFKGSSADFDMGRDIFKGSGALRYMCNPTADGGSIDNAADYTSSLDVHYSSGVYNKSFCLAAKRLSSGSPTGAATVDGVRRAGKAYYEANANYWTASATFKTGCVGVLDAANALGYSAADVASLQQSFADVGVACAPTGGTGGGGGGTNAIPTTSITSPASGSTVSGTVTVTATAADSDGTVAKVVFKLPDGTSVTDTTSPYSVTWNSTTFPDGAGTITATATDNTGATSTASTVNVTVANGTGGGGGGTGDWSASATPNAALKDLTAVCASVSVTGAGNAADVKLDLSGTHTYRSVLKATLAHNGTTATAFATKTFPSSSGTFSLASKAIAGFSGSATGTWTLCVTDSDGYGDSGTLKSFSVHD